MDAPEKYPNLLQARGKLIEVVLAYFNGLGELPRLRWMKNGDPYSDDLQLALHICYALHYRGFAEVDDARLEWDPALLTLRT
jgi:hypothetical protein